MRLRAAGASSGDVRLDTHIAMQLERVQNRGLVSVNATSAERDSSAVAQSASKVQQQTPHVQKSKMRASESNTELNTTENSADELDVVLHLVHGVHLVSLSRKTEEEYDEKIIKFVPVSVTF